MSDPITSIQAEARCVFIAQCPWWVVMRVGVRLPTVAKRYRRWRWEWICGKSGQRRWRLQFNPRELAGSFEVQE